MLFSIHSCTRRNLIIIFIGIGGNFVKIDIPAQLSPLNALNFSKFLSTQHRESKFLYDFSRMQHCPAFGMLMVSNAIRSNIAAFPNAEHIPINYDITQGCQYASELGFFQACGWDIGRLPNSKSYGDTYIPIKKISIKDLQERYLSYTIVLGEMIDRHSLELASTLTQNKSSETTKTIQYCVREIIRNSFEHGKTEEVWICGQFWENRSTAQIGIIDSGCGIFKSLRQNRYYNPRNDKDANKLALQPGVTRTYGIKQYDDFWSNSGYGLFMSSSICCMGGSFWLCSGKDATLVNSDGQHNYEIAYNGTAVCMDICTNRIKDIEKLLPEIAAKGNSEAKEQGSNRVLTASKVSTVASLTKFSKNNH